MVGRCLSNLLQTCVRALQMPTAEGLHGEAVSVGVMHLSMSPLETCVRKLQMPDAEKLAGELREQKKPSCRRQRCASDHALRWQAFYPSFEILVSPGRHFSHVV